MESINTLIVGGGAREHALAWKISQSDRCGKLFVAPGNAGTDSIAINVEQNLERALELHSFIREHEIGLVLVGPEQPLCDGITDELKRHFGDAFRVVGPSKHAAQLESSKHFAKQFMQRHNIPTADFHYFTKDQNEQLKTYLEGASYPLVLKADGLAAGKGVVICNNREEADRTVHSMFIDSKFGLAGERLLVEEFLEGIELSVFVITDGKDYVILPEAKDYKRIGEGDTGPNTGGMGAVSPVPFADKEYLKKVEDLIIKPTVRGIKKERMDYKGFIFFGLMDVKGDPKVIEYNVRMGDPETEVVVPRINSDFFELLIACADGNLSFRSINVDPRTATTVILASGGYPEDYKKDKEISGLSEVSEVLTFHAGTKTLENSSTVTNGGRVLAITAYGDSMDQALEKSYRAATRIDFDGKYFRKDIGFDLR